MNANLNYSINSYNVIPLYADDSEMITLANREDPDEEPSNVASH